MRDCSAIYQLPDVRFLTWPRPLIQVYNCTPDLNPVTRLLVQTLCSDLLFQRWGVAFVTYASYPMPGCNCNHYYYLLPILFKYLFLRSDYILWSTSDSRHNSLSDKSRTHIRPFIWTYPLGSSRVMSRSSSTRLCYQAHCLLVTTLPSPLLIKEWDKWLKLMLTSQKSGQDASG